MKLNNQLIEQIKQGKAIHYDIDNVELLQKVAKKCFPNSYGNPIGRYRYYYSYLDSGCMEGGDNTDREAIPLSSFLTQNKQMVSVEEVLRKLDELAKEDSADTVRYSLQ